ncbi:magnesium/cobalt transporter CorA [Rhodospirillum sp. A1_3_36]|uniref:magnesium/cobalt transporter CorA n=1 Tax=Rhodospirillum sp. A1_3_36 TaxID=3391666 RepID=UPI0039A63E5A
MIFGYWEENGRLKRAPAPLHETDRIIWYDLIAPTAREEAQLESILNIDVPTREEMEEIEISSRLYQEDDAIFMTATLLSATDTDNPQSSPVTFVLTNGKLLTIRYSEPKAFEAFPMRAEKTNLACFGGEKVLLALLEAIVDRLADVIERDAREIDRLSQEIFAQDTPPSSKAKGPTARSKDYQKILKTIGRKGDLTSDIRESMVSLLRLFVYLAQVTTERKSTKDSRARVKTLQRDAQSLIDHATFLSSKITFLLDATLGMINIEQNAIIKIFSVVAVIFLPPTLVASIYGMNFQFMPELGWHMGYPLALLIMLISAILPYRLFKRWGWL